MNPLMYIMHTRVMNVLVHTQAQCTNVFYAVKYVSLTPCTEQEVHRVCFEWGESLQSPHCFPLHLLPSGER